LSREPRAARRPVPTHGFGASLYFFGF
jgi:hypothetical protein